MALWCHTVLCCHCWLCVFLGTEKKKKKKIPIRTTKEAQSAVLPDRMKYALNGDVRGGGQSWGGGQYLAGGWEGSLKGEKSTLPLGTAHGKEGEQQCALAEARAPAMGGRGIALSQMGATAAILGQGELWRASRPSCPPTPVWKSSGDWAVLLTRHEALSLTILGLAKSLAPARALNSPGGLRPQAF